MKVFLFFLFLAFTQITFAQEPYSGTKQHSNLSSLNSELQGDWYLSMTKTVDGYGYITDSTSFTSNQYKNRKITFKGDSVVVFPDTSLRFYTGGIRNYKYKIEHDSIIRTDFIKVFIGNRRKLKELESYELVKCSRDELILKSYKHLNSSIDLSSISIYYVYRRESVDSLLSLINGNWYSCSKDFKEFGSESMDTSQIIFKRLKSNLACNEYDHNLDLIFYRNEYETLCSIGSYTKYIGNAYITTFMIDPKNNLLYMGGEDYIIYDIINLNPNELIISLNKEKTEFYKKNTHNNK